jgi:hypothetical protein
VPCCSAPRITLLLLSRPNDREGARSCAGAGSCQLNCPRCISLDIVDTDEPTEPSFRSPPPAAYLGWPAFLLFVLLTSPRGSARDAGAAAADHGPGPASAALAVSVSETPDAVLLHIRASGDVEPGSVDVRFAGRKAVVLARDAEGRAIHSQAVRLPAPVVEEGSSADYDADGALVMTLRKQATAQDAGPTGDPEAAAR